MIPRPVALLAACASLQLACTRGDDVARAPAAKPAPPTWIPATPLPPVPAWRLASTTTSPRVELGAGFVGVVHQGVRLVVDGSGAVYAASAHRLSISAIEQVPEHLGGGFVFVGAEGTWHAASFVDVPRLLDPAPARALSFGAERALVVRDDGGRRLVDVAQGAVSRVDPPGAHLLAASLDGRIEVAVADGGRSFDRRDRGAWTELTPRLGAPGVRGVVAKDEGVEVTTASGESFLVDAAGTRRVAPTLARSTPRREDGWRDRTPPLTLAVTQGAPLFDDQVLVFEDGSAFVVSTRTGQVLAEEPGATPPDLPCRAARFDREVLALCVGDDRTVVASRPIEGGPTRIEAEFRRRGTLSRGEGDTLSFDGPCDGSASRPGTACVRTEGRWMDLDRSAQLSDAPAGATLRRVLDVPTRDSVLSVIAGPNGGLVDLGSGKRWPLTPAQQAALEASMEPREPVEHRARVIGEGAFEVWSHRGGSVRVLDGGKVLEPSTFRFATLVYDGPRALGRLGGSADGRLFQSLDWGKSFAAIDGPPLDTARDATPTACSEVGCRTHQFLRIGWSIEPPGASFTARPTKAPSVDAAREPLPELRCAAIAAPERRLAPGAEDRRAGLGAEALPGQGEPSASYFLLSALGPRGDDTVTEALRAVLPTPPEGAPPGPRGLRYLAPFDPSPSPRAATLDLRDHTDHAALTGTPSSIDDLTSIDQGFALPITGGGLLLGGSSPSTLWVDGATARPVGLGPDGGELRPVAAAKLDGSTLAVLATDPAGRVVVRRVSRGAVATELELPAPVDPALGPDTFALGIGADGQVAVIASPRRGPPTDDDPAWSFTRGAAPRKLAPWATLTPASSPACASSKGLRVALATHAAWITSGPGIAVDQPAWLELVWGEDRICVSAVDLPGARIETPVRELDARVVARFDGTPRAALLGFGEGVQVVDRRSCELGAR